MVGGRLLLDRHRDVEDGLRPELERTLRKEMVAVERPFHRDEEPDRCEDIEHEQGQPDACGDRGRRDARA
jgi:hypothetical protein